MSLKDLGEFGLIEMIKSRVHKSAPDLLVGIDDDAAVFRLSKDRVALLTTDAFIEGVHFDLGYFTFYQLGWRALAANLSDIAAMAGLPKYAVVALGLPAGTSENSVMELYRGMSDMADEFHVLIVGGDTIKSPARIYISVTVLGEVEADKMTRRSTARVGEGIYVTGNLGCACAGRRVLSSLEEALKQQFASTAEKHLCPMPRVEVARHLAENFAIHSMIDISDGLASEINHLCRLSEVGAVINETELPLNEEVKQIAKTFGQKALDYGLYGGEDFELLFTAPREDRNEILNACQQKFGLACSLIGEVVEKTNGIKLKDRKNQLTPILRVGFDHFSSDV
ncbi:MAG: thiamine-phosphate kinase [bacterium]